MLKCAAFLEEDFKNNFISMTVSKTFYKLILVVQLMYAFHSQYKIKINRKLKFPKGEKKKKLNLHILTISPKEYLGGSDKEIGVVSTGATSLEGGYVI